MREHGRVPKGVSTGGQFASDQKGEDPTINLGSPPSEKAEALRSAALDSVTAVNINLDDLGLTPARARREKEQRVMSAAKSFTDKLPNLDDETAFEHLYSCVRVAEDPEKLKRAVDEAIAHNDRA